MLICQAAIQRIIDADTMEIVARVWPGQTQTEQVRLLCRGETAVDAWEKRGKERPLGEVAHAFVAQELTGCAWVALSVSERRDNFGRILAAVFYLPGATDIWAVINNGIDLGARLISRGHATPFVRSLGVGVIQQTPKDW
jgi:endonuclease YncB( thermonuclease family)